VPERGSARRAWVQASLWLAVMITGTSLPGTMLPPLENGLDKVAHFGINAILAFLVLRALRRGGATPREVWWVVPAIMAYGALDELHQLWIPFRDASVNDWLADSLGAVSGFGCSIYLFKSTWAKWFE